MPTQEPTQQVWQWKNFSAGFSEDKYIAGRDQFYDGESIDVATNPRFVQLSGALEDTGWVLASNTSVRGIFNLTQWGGSGILVTTNTGRIYLNGSLVYDLTLLSPTVDPNNRDVYNVASLNVGGTQYLYFICRNQIHRSDIACTPGAFQAGYKTFTSSNSIKRPLINNFNRVLFGAGNNIIEMDASEVVQTVLELSMNETITGLTVFSDQYHVFTNQNGINGWEYLWDGVQNEVDASIIWANLPILSAVANGPNSYVIAGFNQFYADLYISSGLSRQKISLGKDGTSSNSRQFYDVLSMREDVVYIPGSRGVYSYGNYFPGTNSGLTRPMTLNTQNVNNFITAITTGTATSYIGTASYSGGTGKVYSYSHNLPANYPSSGFIESNMFYGANIWETKIIDEIDIGYSLINEDNNGGTIQLYARNSENSAYQLITTITDTTKRFHRVYKNQLPDGLGEFNVLQYKAVMNSADGRTPAISEISTLYKNNIKTA